jgi:hypothetical protein
MLLFLFLVNYGFAQRAIPDDNLAYPILITLGDNSSGSGFFLSSAGAVYLVTAKHVLFKDRPKQEVDAKNPDLQELRSAKATLLCYSKDPLAWIIREGGRSEGLLCYKHVV